MRRLRIASTLALFLAARGASAEEATATSEEEIASSAAVPPPSHARYIQYGVAFTGEFVGVLSSPGPMCDGAVRATGEHEPTCILGSGGGVAVRLGYRTPSAWYFGGALELSKQDPNKLYRLAILKQLRAEARYYFRPELQTQPFLTGGLGVAAYGNEFDVTDTFGPLASLGVGAETQISRQTVFVVDVAYRAVYFTRFTDTSGADRPAGIATILGIGLALEERDPL
jgi:hypothetical protein